MPNNYYLRLTGMLVMVSVLFLLAGRMIAHRPTNNENNQSITTTSQQSFATNTSKTETDPPSQISQHTSNEALRVFGSIPYWDQKKAIAVFKKHVDAFDMISVFWYRLNADGTISAYKDAAEDQSLITFAHAHNVQVFALISNLSESGNWSAERVDAAIATDADRTAHIEEILKLVEKNDFDGVTIDYEFLKDRQTAIFSRFITELAAALHAKGKLLAVTVHAQLPNGPTRGQNISSLQSADIISLMTYDEHWDTSAPGAPASLPWVEDVLNYTISLGVNPKKIYMGIPLYGYDWPQKGNDWGQARGIEYDQVVQLVNQYDADVIYDPDTLTPYFSYTVNGVRHEVWFDNAFSTEDRLDLARQLGIAGVFFWRQGREDERIYDLLQK